MFDHSCMWKVEYEYRRVEYDTKVHGSHVIGHIGRPSNIVLKVQKNHFSRL